MTSEPDWLKRAKETASYHREQRLSNGKRWTIAKTASSLKRSFGSIAEDLLLYRESKIYDLTVFEFAFEAINFIRMKKKERELEE